ncbi:hypothetical protein ABIB62_000005 [Mucilaginibacter sp. UYP25]|uniref:hypothetical protein n=1 Tax=unclassified Mucilaginibacter TaxID=2617802 RepID=UPI00339197F0
MTRKLNWPVLKALHAIYTKGSTSAQVQGDDFIKYLLDHGQISHKHGKLKTLVRDDGFDGYYRQYYLAKFQYYMDFLEKAGIDTDARKTFTEDDIQTLMMIYENRAELAAKLVNVEDFSAKIFEQQGSKYLKKKASVRNAVLKILGVADFSQSSRELQWRLVVDHTHPEAVILCENRSFLKQTWLASELTVKLWQVGGNNIKMVDDIDHMDLKRPIYYSCDWDFDGLSIFCRIKAKLSLRGVNILLLFPPPPHMRLPVDSFEHYSRWSADKPFSGLSVGEFKNHERELIQELISANQWIEEESSQLGEMYRYTLELNSGS